jgi:uncharacterized membrane protein
MSSPSSLASVREYYERARTSLFSLPAVLILASVGLARLTTLFDEVDRDLPLLLPAGVAAGRLILSTIAGATITVAAIVFSMTAVAVQLASSQYSPRVVGGLFQSPLQRWVIGVVMGTFTFSLTALGLGSGADADGLGHPLTVTVALILAVTSMLLIVAFIDRTTRSITVSEIIRRIAERAMAATALASHSSASGAAVGDEPGLSVPEPPSGEGSADLVAASGGWVVRLDAADLGARLPPGTTVRLAERVGSYVSPGDVIATVWPAEAASEATEQMVRRSLVLGRFRDPERDAAFAIRLLVDIALRALSPGVNDPTTAIDVLQHLRGPMRQVLFERPSPRVFSLPGNRKVVVPETLSHSNHVRGAFSEIRLAARDQPEVIRTLLEVLADLTNQLVDADLSSRADPLRLQARLAVEGARSGTLGPEDLEPIMRVAERFGGELASGAE